MSQLKLLQGATDIYGVAGLLGFQPSMLAYILYKVQPTAKYVTFDIPKRTGGKRSIAAPIAQLKLAQSRLSDLLQNCVEEIATTSGRVDHSSHGFTRERSIATNARMHRHRRWVFNTDIQDFFGSINFGRVWAFFQKNRDFALQPRVATAIAQLACHQNALPQGSPCSPVISNLIGHILDIRLIRLAQIHGCTYSRYADDLTFSTNKPQFPLAIAMPFTPNLWVAGGDLTQIVGKSGFALNSIKTRMQYRNSRQEVTGLVVNKKVNVRAEYRHNVRAMVHRLLNTGAYEITKKSIDASGNVIVARGPGDLNQLHGMLGFIDGVDLLNKRLPKGPGAARESLSSKEETYGRFLLYKDFYAAKLPVLLCEGATDNIYLLHAIRQMAKQNPDLAEVDPAGKISLKLRLFKYTKSGTGRILGIRGGAGDLKNWMARYERAMREFKAPGKQSPVIVIIDSDDAAKGIWSFVQSITKQKPTPSDPYTHVRGNLYVVPVPLPPGESSAAIESGFDAAALAIKVDGKMFCADKTFDEKLYFGKMVFAHKVVTPNADTINFKGFTQLLTNISKAIADHKKRYPPTP